MTCLGATMMRGVMDNHTNVAMKRYNGDMEV